MNTLHTTVRFLLLVSFVVAGAACSASTAPCRDRTLDARLELMSSLGRTSAHPMAVADARAVRQ